MQWHMSFSAYVLYLFKSTGQAVELIALKSLDICTDLTHPPPSSSPYFLVSFRHIPSLIVPAQAQIPLTLNIQSCV